MNHMKKLNSSLDDIIRHGKKGKGKEPVLVRRACILDPSRAILLDKGSSLQGFNSIHHALSFAVSEYQHLRKHHCCGSSLSIYHAPCMLSS